VAIGKMSNDLVIAASKLSWGVSEATHRGLVLSTHPRNARLDIGPFSPSDVDCTPLLCRAAGEIAQGIVVLNVMGVKGLDGSFCGVSRTAGTVAAFGEALHWEGVPSRH
jgi:hypothetical protein